VSSIGLTEHVGRESMPAIFASFTFGKPTDRFVVGDWDVL
jgi:hypothetical protein